MIGFFVLDFYKEMDKLDFCDVFQDIRGLKIKGGFF
jgi:hypothetical protein